MKKILLSLLLSSFCSATQAQNTNTNDSLFQVKIHTSLGDVVVQLYNETPLHKANFIKLVRSGYYNGSDFHRIIKGFMVQGGGKGSGASDAGYKIPAEILPQFCHQKGALCAARQGDGVNPKKESSGSQFYIVQGEPIDATFISKMKARGQAANTAEEFLKMYEAQRGLAYSPEQIANYKMIGGTPFLDGAYTVFGQVINGIEVVDALAALPTQPGDKPVVKQEMTAELIYINPSTKIQPVSNSKSVKNSTAVDNIKTVAPAKIGKSKRIKIRKTSRK